MIAAKRCGSSRLWSTIVEEQSLSRETFRLVVHRLVPLPLRKWLYDRVLFFFFFFAATTNNIGSHFRRGNRFFSSGTVSPELFVLVTRKKLRTRSSYRRLMPPVCQVPKAEVTTSQMRLKGQRSALRLTTLTIVKFVASERRDSQRA